MAYTQNDLTALERAIAGAQLEVQYGDKRVRFRSLDELERARNFVRDQLNRAAGKRASRVTRLRHAGKGV